MDLLKNMKEDLLKNNFKKFLIEKVRSHQRARKLIQNISDRYYDGHHVGLKNYYNKNNNFPKHVTDHMIDNYDDLPVSHAKIPINKIHMGQSSVDTRGVHNKISKLETAKMKHDSPIEVYHYKGNYQIGNGHHRYLAAKVLGHTHIPAIIKDLSGADK